MCGVTIYKNKINIVSDEINSMLNNDHTVTQAKLHLRECKNCPSRHTRVTHWDYTHQNLTICKSQNYQTAHKHCEKLWVSRGYNNVNTRGRYLLTIRCCNDFTVFTLTCYCLVYMTYFLKKTK